MTLLVSITMQTLQGNVDGFQRYRGLPVRIRFIIRLVVDGTRDFPARR
jgi:hypothetical protein